MANEQMVKRIESKAERRFVIADLHFFHEEIIKYCNRPFKSVKEMNKELIKKWNSVVSENDIVYVLGDFALKYKDKAKVLQIVHMLKGMKVLVMGNHDSKKPQYYVDLGFLWAIRNPILIEDDVVLMHEPPEDKSKVIKGLHYIFGHIHDKELEIEKLNNCKCVSVEKTNYLPVDLDEIIQNMRKKEEE